MAKSAQQFDLLALMGGIEAAAPLDALLTPDQIYETTDAALLVRLAEDSRFDRKGRRIEPKGLAPVFSAMSNGPGVNGGVVVLGIHDKTKEIEGCGQLSDGKINDLESAAMVHCPTSRVNVRRLPVINNEGQEDFLIMFRISYIHNHLVSLGNGDAYERVGDKTIRIDDTRKQQIRVDKGERPFELESSSLQYPVNFDIGAIAAMCERIKSSRGLSGNHKNEGILVNLRLGTFVGNRFVPNNACVLLFAKDPRREFPGATVHFLKYRGCEALSGREFNVEKDRQFEGGISTVIRDAAAMIDANSREFTEWKDGKFTTTTEYPRDAWYELLVNACAHRSYLFRNLPIFVKMFDDKIVFQSPGGLMPGVTVENIYERHHPRNRIIMDPLRETGEVRCINEGTKRVRSEMERAELPPAIFQSQRGEAASVLVTLHNNEALRSNNPATRAHALVGEEVLRALPLVHQQVVIFIAESGRANVADIMALLKDTRWHSTKLKLDALVKRRVLRFVSTKLRDPNAYYEIDRSTDDESTAPH